MRKLLQNIHDCKTCEKFLSPNPVLSVSIDSRIIIIGQAPGRLVHETGIPWNDKSGDKLRSWLDVSKEQFYNPSIFGIMPMGFCYPGTGKNGDLPPRSECAPQWHSEILKQVKSVQLIILIGQYAQAYYLKNRTQETLTDTVRNFKLYLPAFFVLPHPSPRNNIWMAKNRWFEQTVLPELKVLITSLI